MKKTTRNILVVSLAVAMIFSLGITASAASGTVSADTQVTKLQANLEKVQQQSSAAEQKITDLSTKLETVTGIRQIIIQDRIKLLENRLTNLDLRTGNIQLRISICQATAAIKQSGNKLPADTVAALKNDRDQVKQIVASITATKGQINDILSQNKDVLKSKDSAAIENVFQQVFAVQNARKQALTQIGGILQDMSNLLSSSTFQTTGA